MGLQLPPRSDVDVAISAPTPPPFPIPQWRADFLGQNRQPSERGMELIFGRSLQDRALTLYLRETVFSPTFFFLMPGGKIDGGGYLGAPPALRGPNVFHCEFRMGGAQWITMSPVLGLMLNPMAALPPFLTANPPFWIIPGVLMGDFFTDSSGATGVELSVNIPALVGFTIVFKRPLPNITLQMLLEIAALAVQGFSVELPADSALANLFYAELTGTVTLHAAKTLFGKSAGAVSGGVRFNIVDLVDSALRLMKSVREVLDAGAAAADKAADLVAQVFEDPELVVRMIPRSQRGLAVDTALTVAGLGFACHLSAHLLLPDELAAELITYHENKRKRGQGLAALREPPDGAGVSAGHVEWDTRDLVTWDGVVNVGEWTGDKLVAKIRKQASARLTIAARAPIEAGLDELAAKAAAEIVPVLLAASTPQARTAILQEWGLVAARPDVERLLAALSRPSELRDLVRRAIRASTKLTVEVRVDLPETAAQLAADLLPAAFVIAPNGVVTARSGRGQSIRQLGRTELLGRRLERSVNQLIAGRTPDRALSPPELAVWRAETERLLEAEVRTAGVVGNRVGVPAGGVLDLAVELAEPAFGLAELIRADLRTFEIQVPVFDGLRWNEGLRGFLDPRRNPPGPAPAGGKAEQRDGFVIRPRPVVRHHAPDFRVPAPTRNARFQVRLLAGAYQILVPGQTPVALPEALVATTAPGPERATKLRQLLIVEENRSTRNLNAADRDLLENDPVHRGREPLQVDVVRAAGVPDQVGRRRARRDEPGRPAAATRRRVRDAGRTLHDRGRADAPAPRHLRLRRAVLRLHRPRAGAAAARRDDVAVRAYRAVHPVRRIFAQAERRFPPPPGRPRLVHVRR